MSTTLKLTLLSLIACIGLSSFQVIVSYAGDSNSNPSNIIVSDPLPGLTDENFYVHRRAASELLVRGDTGNAAIPTLINNLSSTNVLHRLTAATLIKHLGWHSGSATPSLARALDDEYLGVRLAAVEALQNIPTREAQQLLQTRADRVAEWSSRRERALLGMNTRQSIEPYDPNYPVGKMPSMTTSIASITFRHSLKEGVPIWLYLQGPDDTFVAKGIYRTTYADGTGRPIEHIQLAIVESTRHKFALPKGVRLNTEEGIVSLVPFVFPGNWTLRETTDEDWRSAIRAAEQSLTIEFQPWNDRYLPGGVKRDKMSLGVIDAKQDGLFLIAGFELPIDARRHPAHTMVFWKKKEAEPWKQIAGMTEEFGYPPARYVVVALLLENLVFTARERDGALLRAPIYIPESTTQ